MRSSSESLTIILSRLNSIITRDPVASVQLMLTNISSSALSSIHTLKLQIAAHASLYLHGNLILLTEFDLLKAKTTLKMDRSSRINMNKYIV